MEKSKEDLGIKIGSPEMKEWKDIIDSQKKVILNSKINIKVAEKVLVLAESEYLKATAAFKR